MPGQPAWAWRLFRNGSANYEKDVFEASTAFDIARTPNPHLGFGGNGPHVCLGASLARLELRLVFDAIADIMPMSPSAPNTAACAPHLSTAASVSTSHTADREI